MKESVGEFYTILETGDVIYIGADLPDEYAGSNDTYSHRMVMPWIAESLQRSLAYDG